MADVERPHRLRTHRPSPRRNPSSMGSALRQKGSCARLGRLIDEAKRLIDEQKRLTREAASLKVEYPQPQA